MTLPPGPSEPVGPDYPPGDINDVLQNLTEQIRSAALTNASLVATLDATRRELDKVRKQLSELQSVETLDEPYNEDAHFEPPED